MNHGQRLLVLGGSYMQLPVAYTARAMGLTLIIADGNKEAIARKLAEDFWHIDLRNIKALIIKAKHKKIDAVVTSATDFSYVVSCIAKACDLPSISVDAAKKANFKHYMRDALSKKNISIPHWTSIRKEETSNEDYCKEKAKEIGYPLVVKPSDNMGARGIICVETESYLISAIQYAMLYSVSHTILLEQKLTGPELSIDSFILDGKIYPLGIADRHIVFDPYFIETGHSIPSQCSLEMQKDALNILEKAALSLGIINGVCKGDIIFHHKKAYIGECAARLSGGYMSGWTIPYAYNTHPTYYAIELSLNRNIKKKVIQLSKISPKNHVLERSLLMLPGKLMRIKKTIPSYTHIPCVHENNNSSFSSKNKDNSTTSLKKKRLISKEGIQHVYIGVQAQKKYDFPKNNTEKAGSIIVMAQSRYKAVALSSHALLDVYFDIQRNNKVEHFLYGAFTQNHFSHYGKWYCYPLLGKMLLKQTANNDIIQCFLFQTMAHTISKRIQNCIKIAKVHKIKRDNNNFSFPFYIPKIIVAKKERGSWTHVSLPKTINLSITQKHIHAVQDIKESITSLLFPAFVRTGWQGLHYTLQLIQKCLT